MGIYSFTQQIFIGCQCNSKQDRYDAALRELIIHDITFAGCTRKRGIHFSLAFNYVGIVVEIWGLGWHP